MNEILATGQKCNESSGRQKRVNNAAAVTLTYG